MHPELEVAKDYPISSLSRELSHEQGQDAHGFCLFGFFCNHRAINSLSIFSF